MGGKPARSYALSLHPARQPGMCGVFCAALCCAVLCCPAWAAPGGRGPGQHSLASVRYFVATTAATFVLLPSHSLSQTLPETKSQALPARPRRAFSAGRRIPPWFPEERMELIAGAAGVITNVIDMVCCVIAPLSHLQCTKSRISRQSGFRCF